MSIALITSGQIEGWVIRCYFSGTLEKDLIPYAAYWIRRLGLSKDSVII